MEHWKNKSLVLIIENIEGVNYVEEWLPMPGRESTHNISSFGRIKKLAVCINGQIKPERVLVSSVHPKGYLRIFIKYKGEKGVSYFIHRLVALAFLPILPDKPHVNHSNGDKKNNHYSRLEWCTNLENIEHSFKIGLRKRKIITE